MFYGAANLLGVCEEKVFGGWCGQIFLEVGWKIRWQKLLRGRDGKIIGSRVVIFVFGWQIFSEVDMAKKALN